MASASVGTLLEIKHIEKIRLPHSGQWTIRVAGSDDFETTSKDVVDKYAQWAESAFLVRQKIVQSNRSEYPDITIKILIRSELLRRALQVVMNVVEGVNWNGVVLKLDPELLLAFLPRLREPIISPGAPNTPEAECNETRKHMDFLIDFLTSQHASTLGKLETLRAHEEITFALLWGIFIPGEIVFALCETTGKPRLFRLKKMEQGWNWRTNTPVCNIACEYVDASEDPSAASPFGLATHQMIIEKFDGIRKIRELPAYPIKYHSAVTAIQEKLTHRGRMWANLHGRHHKQYNGLASRKNELGELERVRVDGRIMLDRETLARVEPDYLRPIARIGGLKMGQIYLLFKEGNHFQSKGSQPFSDCATGLNVDELLLATPIVYGFSLDLKRWLEFDIECVTDVQWNDDSFKNLALDVDRKTLLQGLVNSHSALKGTADDFVAGKGAGLIMNLFGPPGVGKTLTVEATTEYLRRPLYVVSAGDLGTTSANLDRALTKIFNMVPVWDAVVLIDEADVFLEERGTADLERNAMVAVFLRQLEYFRGILFLTTNRVKQFDAAFQSRIHLSLRYNDLSPGGKEQLWRTFLGRTRTTEMGCSDITTRQLQTLACKDLNGRQIKNIVRLALALAMERKETMTYAHLQKTMAVVDNWSTTEPDKAVVTGLGAVVALVSVLTCAAAWMVMRDRFLWFA
ncbi:P-loop containing nucleoside triphosphate hydrolase protein [Mycena leptocephala]|nr:P-loop containing nucleoside triphosphate hydrolase protein [Mycena leptocephala]